jgi:hypothetical protein
MDCVYVDKTPLLADFRRVERASALRRELLTMISTSGRAGSGRRKRSNCETPFTLRRRKTPQQFSYRTSSRTNQGARTTLHQQLSTPSTISLRPPNKNSSLQLKPYVLQNYITAKFHKRLPARVSETTLMTNEREHAGANPDDQTLFHHSSSTTSDSSQLLNTSRQRQ